MRLRRTTPECTYEVFPGGLRPPRPSRLVGGFPGGLHPPRPSRLVGGFPGGLRPPRPSRLVGGFPGGLRPPRPSRLVGGFLGGRSPPRPSRLAGGFLGGRSPPRPSRLAGGFPGGLRPPRPSRSGGLAVPTGRGMGKPGFPIPQPRLAAPATPAGVRFDKLTAGGETRFPPMFTSVAYHGTVPPTWENRASPNSDRCRDHPAPPPAGGWGNLVSPYFSLSPLCGCAAQRRHENNYS